MLEGEKCFLEQFVKYDTDEQNPASVDFRITVYPLPIGSQGLFPYIYP